MDSFFAAFLKTISQVVVLCTVVFNKSGRDVNNNPLIWRGCVDDRAVNLIMADKNHIVRFELIGSSLDGIMHISLD